jgi:hypothetical protein
MTMLSDETRCGWMHTPSAPPAEVERCGHPQCEMPAGSFRIDGLRLCERCYGVASRQVLSAADILSLAPADPSVSENGSRQPERDRNGLGAYQEWRDTQPNLRGAEEDFAWRVWRAAYEAGRRGR